MRRRRPAPSASRLRAPSPARAEPSGYVVTAESEIGGEVHPMEPAFLDRVEQVRALTVVSASPARSLAELRGYQRADLLALAEVGYHYLMGGATELARIIFEGLAAIQPKESYFALGCGLAYDHEGNVEEAMRCYRTASKLDPRDARPDINRAELFIAARDRKSAFRLLQRALAKAKNAGDMDLFRKAQALQNRLA